MRQYEKTLFSQPGYYIFSNLFRLQSSCPQETLSFAVSSEQHLSADSLRTKARNSDSGISVRDRKPFGKGHGRMLRNGVRRRTNLSQKSSRGRCVQKVT